MGELVSMAVGRSRDIHDVVVSERDALYRSSIVDICLGALLLIVGTGGLFVFFMMIVFLEAVATIHPYFNNRLELDLEPGIDADIFVSRKRAGDFKKWLDR
jgi:hypothetical protein